MKIQNRPVVRGQKRRFLPACASSSVGWLPKAPVKAGVRRRGQKSRLLPAVYAVMSAEIAAGDFGQ